MTLEEKIIWGGIYKVNHSRWLGTHGYNDQIYRQAVPVRRKDGSIWMQDTYQIRDNHQLNFDYIQRLIDLQDPKKGEYVIRESYDWYHKSNEKIDEEILVNDYELICDLNKYRVADKSEDIRNYKPEDVVHGIHLCNEYGYSKYGDTGISLIKKDAQRDELSEFLAMKQDIHNSFDYPNSFGLIHQFISKHDELTKHNVAIPPQIEHDYQMCLWIHNRLKQMNEEIRDYKKTHAYHFDWTFTDTIVADVHEDIHRYLIEDCYCPNEIYDFSGFCYMCLYDSDDCKVIYKDSKYLIIVALFDNTHLTQSLPQIVLFDIKNEKISDSTRFDVTSNNIQVLTELIKNGKMVNKVDTYSKYVFPEDIQSLIMNWKI